MSDVVLATCTTHLGETLQLHEGELWEASHPVVKAHPDLFTDDLLSWRGTHRAPEESAPPAKRGPGRPKKDTTEA